MSAIRAFAAAILITASASARGQLPPPPDPAPATPPAAPGEGTPSPFLGLQLGAGLPDGLALSVILRPYTPYLRLNAGVSWDYFGFGLHGGATFLPFHARFTPTLTVEGGTFFDANLHGALSNVNIPDLFRDASRSVGVGYLAGMVGVETGNPDRFVFFLRAGVARLWFTLPPSAGGSLTASEMSAAANVPAAVLGVAFYIW